MKLFKFKLLLIFIFSFFNTFLIFITSVFSQSLENVGNIGRIPNITRYSSLEDIINLLTSLIRPVFILTFLGVILYGAWTWLTAGDKDDKVKKARQIITAGIIGFSLAVIAPVIVQIIGNLLGINNPFSIINENN